MRCRRAEVPPPALMCRRPPPAFSWTRLPRSAQASPSPEGGGGGVGPRRHRSSRSGRELAAAAAVGQPAVEGAGGGGGGGIAGAMLLELPAVMEKCGAPQRAAMMPLRRNSGGVAEVGEFGGVAGVYSGEEEPSSPHALVDQPWRGQNAVTITGPSCCCRRASYEVRDESRRVAAHGSSSLRAAALLLRRRPPPRLKKPERGDMVP